MGKILIISILFGFLISLLVIIVLEISIDEDTNRLSKLDLEYLDAKEIIENKDEFSKIEIQKAQQKIDEYNSVKLWK